MSTTVTVEQALQLAQTHWLGGRRAEAETVCREILAAFPGQPGAWYILAGLAADAGRPDLAVDFIGRSLAAEPNQPAAHFHLGELHLAAGQRELAAASYAQAVQRQPDFPEALCRLGSLWRELGQVDAGTRHLERAVALAPRWAVGQRELGKAYFHRERLADARRVLERSLALDGDDADALNVYAAVCSVQLQPEKAREHFARAVALDPQNFQAWNNLGFMHKKLGQLAEARACYERALAIRPGYASAYNNLGTLFRNLGQPERGLEYTRRGVEADPANLRYGSDLVLGAYYHPGLSRDALAAELRAWNTRYAVPMRHHHRPHGNNRDPDRRLRVGYVSPDFCVHVISHFTIPLLEAHDPAQVEVYAYSGAAVPDDLTARLRRAAGHWREVRSLTDVELAEQVRADGIDVLVDLSLHTGDNRLRTFACQPAPVGVSWLGFAGSSGVEAIRYRLSDPRLDPPGADESWSLQTPVRLPEVWCCYHPIHEAPPVSALPALRNGYVTFGSLNNFVKVNAPTLRRWALALRAVGRSRLLLHAAAGGPRDFVLGVLAEEGIDAGRIEFVAKQDAYVYLQTYGRIDVGLDPFPFNGMTTTCDALWMGVPVLSLPGELPASRTGLSLLHAVGLEAWAARDEAEYAARAAALTANLPKLQRTRAGLRRRMEASPLMDAPRFARQVEAAYRQMWRQWVEQGAA